MSQWTLVFEQKRESQQVALARKTNMKTAKLTTLLLPVVLSTVGSAMAGDSGYTTRTSTTISTHSKWEGQPRAVRVAASPFVFLGRALETFLHSPQILAEGIEGDRALVNQRGVLAPREVPVEDRIISPTD